MLLLGLPSMLVHVSHSSGLQMASMGTVLASRHSTVLDHCCTAAAATAGPAATAIVACNECRHCRFAHMQSTLQLGRSSAAGCSVSASRQQRAGLTSSSSSCRHRQPLLVHSKFSNPFDGMFGGGNKGGGGDADAARRAIEVRLESGATLPSTAARCSTMQQYT